ncbi:MAG: GNAT family acetyltransferase [Gammaproteobacteria bacterium]
MDRDALIALWRKVFPDDPPHNDPARVLAAKLKVDDLIFICEYDGKIVGACMAGYDGHRGWLYAVAVSPEQRRHGVGTLLVKAALKELKNLGCIKVNLQVRPTNTTVAAFYSSLGFAVEDRLSMGLLMQ